MYELLLSVTPPPVPGPIDPNTPGLRWVWWIVAGASALITIGTLLRKVLIPLLWRLLTAHKIIEEELNHNGGNSVKDKVHEACHSLKQLHSRMDSFEDRLDDHIEKGGKE